MHYDLDTLEDFCRELGFVCSRISADTLEISILDDIILEFMNLKNEDSLIGFKDMPWHFHDKLELGIGENSYIELDELDILQGLKDGDILIVEEYLNGTLNDRLLAHKKEKVDVQYIQAGEEVRIRSVAQKDEKEDGSPIYL